MARNLVVCIDGTSDFAAKYPTHVFRLFRALDRSDNQLAYYDGGVGSLAHLSVFGKPMVLSGLLDLAAATSIRRNFESAYSFLVQNYRQGDRIFLFGFSRGAYAARALAGAIAMFGLLRPEQLNLLGYVWQEYRKFGDTDAKNNSTIWRLPRRMKRAFSRDVKIEYLGIWDTVSSVGFLKLITLPYTTSLVGVNHVRHAVSIDEKRNMFPENLIKRTPAHEECWFPGVHRDVGGGGKPATIPLSMFAFDWVLHKARHLKLKIDPTKEKTMREPAPNACTPNNDSLVMTIVYGFAGLLPMKWWNDRLDRYAWKWPNLWHTRRVPAQATIHQSAIDRMNCANVDYEPKKLDLTTVSIEPHNRSQDNLSEAN